MPTTLKWYIFGILIDKPYCKNFIWLLSVQTQPLLMWHITTYNKDLILELYEL